MAKKTVSELKEYFKPGKRPTGIQFSNFIDSFLHLDNPEMFPTNYKHKDFIVRFSHQQNNMAADVLLGNNQVHGNIEIQIVGAYNNENTVGVIRKQIIVGANMDNRIWNSPITRIIEASGPIVNNIYIGDIVWDPALAQYKFTVYHTRSTGNTYALRVIHHGNSAIPLEKAVISDPYVNQLTGQNKHFVHYNENLGVGTVLPESKLHVVQNPSSKPIDAMTIDVGSFGTPQNAHKSHYFRVRDIGASNNHVPFIIKGSGNVGIGTESPAAKTHIVSGYVFPDSEGALIIGDTSQVNLRFGCSDRYSWMQGHGTAPLYINPLGNNLILNKDGGNVGIGTNNPDQKLTVKGKIHAEDVIIDANIPADYVFQKYFDGQSSIKPDYQMPTIQELESFVKENKHLPDIPSAEKMSQDGVNLGDFQIKLLQKIEELTLYVISQNKEIEKLKATIKE